MSVDRTWMTRRAGDNGIGVSFEFRQGVQEFLNFAFDNTKFVHAEKIRCPCRSCMNSCWLSRGEVNFHLFNRGFTVGYSRWTHHGESFFVEPNTSSHVRSEFSSNNESYQCGDMILDAMGHGFDQTIDNDLHDDIVEDEPTSSAKDFYQMLKDTEVPLYSGHEKHSKLSAVTKLLHFKSESGCSEKHFNGLLTLIKEFLPEDNELPGSYYLAKKMVRGLGLGYEKIDACREDCMLYWGENKDEQKCSICGLPRYQPNNGDKGKDIPWKVLRYFPIAPRLQRLYMSTKTSEHMRWHSTQTKVPGELRHPVDGEAWKNFNATHPSFAKEDRNVRLGLATDGFTPFALSSTPHSTWPVILVPYNLPPWMCMKDAYMFLTLLIPGPQSPSNDIDVYLRPLIDELKMLWETGVHTYDASSKRNFHMRVAAMWTINDFPAYGMMEGWSTHGKMACPVCKDETKAIRLTYSAKPSFFGSHRRFLPIQHRLRRHKDNAHGVQEKRVAPIRLSGEMVKAWLDQLQFPPPGKVFKEHRAEGFGESHNWTKRSIFFELPYWSTLMLRHNLDVMHIVKNVFDNVFNTVMGVKSKTKDHIKGRKDMEEMGIHNELHLVPSKNGIKLIMPKAAFTLKKEQVRKVCEWVKELKLPDGYASNISRCCNLKDCRFYGLKSHDCHIFMLRLIPIAFRDLLPPKILDVLTELSHFFRDLCSTVLRESDMDVLDKKIVLTICKLEKIFPPSFFDCMEHLPIHLAYEAKIGGPVQYRWMYPFERCMRRLKKKVTNKAHVEGSIAEAYIIEELVNFCSLYFEVYKETKHNRVSRNEDIREVDGENLSIFKNVGHAISGSTQRDLTDEEYQTATLYTLMNCTEVEPFIKEFDEKLLASNPNISEKQRVELQNKYFIKWFNKRVVNDNNTDESLRRLGRGPGKTVNVYKGFVINGFRFHTSDVSANRKTQSDGIMVKGSCSNDSNVDYYGLLSEIVELQYFTKKVVMFKCIWFDTRKDKGFRVTGNGLIQVNIKSRLNSYDPFILALQATQVFFAKGVTKKDPNWYTVIKTKARTDYDILQNTRIDAYQEDDNGFVVPNQNSDELINVDLCVAGDPGEEVDPNHENEEIEEEEEEQYDTEEDDNEYQD